MGGREERNGPSSRARVLRRGRTYSIASKGDTPGRNVWREREMKTLGGVREIIAWARDSGPMWGRFAAAKEIDFLYRGESVVVDIEV